MLDWLRVARRNRYVKFLFNSAIIIVLVFATGFVFVFWWHAPEYQPNLISFSETAIDGEEFMNAMPSLVSGKEYFFTCKGTANGQRFVVIDSGPNPYVEPFPFLDNGKHERPSDRIDPTFALEFGSDLRMGRTVGRIVLTRAKTDNVGDTVVISTRFRAPNPGKYQFQLVRIHNPDCWVQTGPLKWEQQKPTSPPIVWRIPVTVKRFDRTL